MQRLLTPLLILACLAALFFLSFGPALFKGEQFAYRDAAHFYYPLYQRVQAEWQAGRWPLWEPEENAGMPLLGNPTAAVFYPGKLIYAALPFAWAARVYIVAHVVLAFIAMLALMRSWGTSWTGSALSALSYAFAEPILFQYCNVIFLVGAAWLPLGFRAADRWLRLGRSSAMLELAVVLAMQFLGGDPQAAYVLGICAGGYALGLSWQRSRRAGSPPPLSPGMIALLAFGVVAAWVAATLFMARWAPTQRAHEIPPQPLPWMSWVQPTIWSVWGIVGLTLLVRWIRRGARQTLLPMLLGLAGSAALAALLTAAQLLPVWEFTARSTRVADAATHEIFAFSLEPLRLFDLLWPNFFGDSFAHNRSWFMILPPIAKHATVWIPSLYLGGLTLVLGLGAMGLRGGTPWRNWLTAIAGITVFASLGDYSSPLWWARWIPAVAHEVGPLDEMFSTPIRQDFYLRDGDGGFYWILATFLPGFKQFRFPCKLITFSTLSLTALAGLGWDRLTTDRSLRTARIASSLLGLTLVGLVFAIVRRDWILACFAPAAQGGLESPFGPMDVLGAYKELRFALVHGAVMLSLALGLALHAWRWPALAGIVALVATTADLAVANTRYVLTVPQQLLEAEPKVVKIIEEAEKKDPAGQPFRIHRMPLWNPRLWTQRSSEDRVRDFVVWERGSIQPKYGLPYGIQYTLTMGVTELYDYEWFFSGFHRKVYGEIADSLGVRSGNQIAYLPRRGFDLWNSRYFVTPVFPHGWKDEFRAFAAFIEHSERIFPPLGAFEGPIQKQQQEQWANDQDFQVFRNNHVFPRAWVVHQARFHRPLSSMSRKERAKPIQEILYARDAFWNDSTLSLFDPTNLAWVEDRELAEFLSGPGAQPDRDSVTLTCDTPQRVELDAVLEKPGLVVLSDVEYPGWRLTIDGLEAPIHRVNFLMRGAAVKAGKHHLVYSYEPRSFYTGRWGSVAGLIVFLLLTGLCRRYPRVASLATSETSGAEQKKGRNPVAPRLGNR